MESVIFRYRSRDLGPQDICFIQRIAAQFYGKGRSPISRALCQARGWVQPNGKLKEYAARDLLLRLEEKGFLDLPARMRPKNNLKRKTFAQAPLFCKSSLGGVLSRYGEVSLRLVTASESYLWDYLVHHYQYLGRSRLVGEHLRYIAFLDGQVAACLGWASTAFKIHPGGAYNKLSALAKERCLYHLFTELVKVDQRNSTSEWKAFRNKLSRLLNDAIRLSNKLNQLTPETYPRLTRRL